MALPSSGTLSLNQIHVEAGGISGTSCSINDSDIRGLISKGSSASMSFSEWYGASAAPPYWEVTVTNALFGRYLGGASTMRFNGFCVANTGLNGGSLGSNAASGSVNSYSQSGYIAGASLRALYVSHHSNTGGMTLGMIVSGNVPNHYINSGWNTIQIIQPNGTITSWSRFYASYGYDSTRNQTSWETTYYGGLPNGAQYNLPPFYAQTNAQSVVRIYN